MHSHPSSSSSRSRESAAASSSASTLAASSSGAAAPPATRSRNNTPHRPNRQQQQQQQQQQPQQTAQQSGPLTPFSAGSSFPPTPSSAGGGHTPQHESSVDPSGFSNLSLLFSANSALLSDSEDEEADPDFVPSSGSGSSSSEDEEEEIDEFGMLLPPLVEEEGEEEEGQQQMGQQQQPGMEGTPARRTRAHAPLTNVQIEELESLLPPIEWSLRKKKKKKKKKDKKERSQQEDEAQSSAPSVSPPSTTPASLPDDDGMRDYHNFLALLNAGGEVADDDDEEFQVDEEEDVEEEEEEEYRNDRSVSISKKELRDLQGDRQREVEIMLPSSTPQPITPARGVMSTRRKQGTLAATSAASAATAPASTTAASPSIALPALLDTTPGGSRSSRTRAASARNTPSFFASAHSSIPTSAAVHQGRKQQQQKQQQQSMPPPPQTRSRNMSPPASRASETSNARASSSPTSGVGLPPFSSTPLLSDSLNLGSPEGSHGHAFPNLFSPLAGSSASGYSAFPAFPGGNNSAFTSGNLLSSSFGPMHNQSILSMQPQQQAPAAACTAASGTVSLPANIVPLLQQLLASIGTSTGNAAPSAVVPSSSSPPAPSLPPAPALPSADWTSVQRQTLLDQLNAHVQLLVQVRYLSLNSVLTPMPPLKRDREAKKKAKQRKKQAQGKEGGEEEDEEDDDEEYDLSLLEGGPVTTLTSLPPDRPPPLLPLKGIWDATTDLLMELVTKREVAMQRWAVTRRQQQRQDAVFADPFANPLPPDALEHRPVLSLLPMLDVWHSLSESAEKSKTHAQWVAAQEKCIPTLIKKQLAQATKNDEWAIKKLQAELEAGGDKDKEAEQAAAGANGKESREHADSDSSDADSPPSSSPRPLKKAGWYFSPLLRSFINADTTGHIKISLLPRIDYIYRKNLWTPGEDALLCAAFERFGRGGRQSGGGNQIDWPRMKHRYLPGRTLHEIQKRFNNLRTRKKLGTGAGGSANSMGNKNKTNFLKHTMASILPPLWQEEDETEQMEEKKEEQNHRLTDRPVNDEEKEERKEAFQQAEASLHTASQASLATSSFPVAIPALPINSLPIPASSSATVRAQTVTVAASTPPLLATTVTASAAAPVLASTASAPVAALPSPSSSSSSSSSSSTLSSRYSTLLTAPGVAHRNLTPHDLSVLEVGLNYFPESHPKRWKCIAEHFLPHWDRLSLRRAYYRHLKYKDMEEKGIQPRQRKRRKPPAFAEPTTTMAVPAQTVGATASSTTPAAASSSIPPAAWLNMLSNGLPMSNLPFPFPLAEMGSGSLPWPLLASAAATSAAESTEAATSASATTTSTAAPPTAAAASSAAAPEGTFDEIDMTVEEEEEDLGEEEGQQVSATKRRKTSRSPLKADPAAAATPASTTGASQAAIFANAVAAAAATATAVVNSSQTTSAASAPPSASLPAPAPTSLLPSSTFSLTAPSSSPSSSSAHAPVFEEMDMIEEELEEEEEDVEAVEAAADATEWEDGRVESGTVASTSAPAAASSSSSSSSDGPVPMVLDGSSDTESEGKAPARSIGSAKGATATPPVQDRQIVDAIVALRANHTEASPNKRKRTAGVGAASPAKDAAAAAKQKTPRQSPVKLPSVSSSHTTPKKSSHPPSSPLPPKKTPHKDTASLSSLATSSELIETVPAPLLQPVSEQLHYSAEQYAYASAMNSPHPSPSKRSSRSHSRTHTPQLNEGEQTGTRMRMRSRGGLSRSNSSVTPTAAPATASVANTASLQPLPFVTPPPSAPSTRPVRAARALAQASLQQQITGNSGWKRAQDRLAASSQLIHAAGLGLPSSGTAVAEGDKGTATHEPAANNNSTDNAAAQAAVQSDNSVQQGAANAQGNFSVVPSPPVPSPFPSTECEWSVSEDRHLLLTAASFGAQVDSWPPHILQSWLQPGNGAVGPPRNQQQINKRIAFLLEHLAKGQKQGAKA